MSAPEAEAVLAGDRRALARAITLIESTRPEHRQAAEALLTALLPYSGQSMRLGISGAPGVGKSTFIEAFGLSLIDQGHKVAVLAVDPSSQRGGGSILGDKTRMEDFSRRPEAFVRPSPAGSSLGGVARRSRESLLACESAGYDLVIVETVGVGQSETAVADMVDMFLLLLPPGGGDELQGIKKGVVELADILVVNKADGDLAAAAARAAAEYRGALQMLRPASRHWSPPVQLCSARTGKGIDEVWDAIGRYRTAMTNSGEMAAKRARQAGFWLWRDLDDSLQAALRADPAVSGELARIEAEVAAGRILTATGARRLLEAFLTQRGGKGAKDPRLSA